MTTYHSCLDIPNGVIRFARTPRRLDGVLKDAATGQHMTGEQVVAHAIALANQGFEAIPLNCDHHNSKGHCLGHSENNPKVSNMTTTTKIPTAFGTPFAGGFYAGRFQIDGSEFALIVATNAQGETPEALWGKYGQDVAEARSCNDGLSNTQAMANAGSKIAQWALDLVINDHNDWYLPSRDELELCYRNLKPTEQENWASFRDGDNPSSLPAGYPYTEESPVQTTLPEFQDGGAEAFSDSWYLSSTQYSPYYAWVQYFGDGHQTSAHKDLARRARAVRRFKVTP
jgi:hypothetical protein